MTELTADCLVTPDWPAPATVRALATTRRGGCSEAPFDTLNLGAHVRDDPRKVRRNRERLYNAVGSTLCWPRQVHGTGVLLLSDSEKLPEAPEADAVTTRSENRVCAVQTADCLPVLLCDRQGTVVSAVHAGWRGLAAGVIPSALQSMAVHPAEVMAWLGPAISAEHFEVGVDVRTAFAQSSEQRGWDREWRSAFRPAAAPGKFMCDLYRLAELDLAACGVTRVYGGNYCTYRDRSRFFSYRRDGQCGRMASLIWLTGQDSH